MAAYTFNSTPVAVGDELILPPINDEVLECIPNLNDCPLEKAVQFGGRHIRHVLESAPLVGDQEYVRVDLIGGHLNPGWHGVAPGWHIDYAGWNPSLIEQARLTEEGIIDRYHTMSIGNNCPTVFLDEPMILDLEFGEDARLNSEIDRLVDEDDDYSCSTYPNNRWTTWNWWNIHASSPATESGWRLLVRVIESTRPPKTANFVQPNRVIFAPRDFRRR